MRPGSVYVWEGPSGQLKYNTTLAHLKRACATAGIAPSSLHKVRHWAGLMAVSTGMAERSIATFLRHTDTKATARYSHVVPAQLRALGDRLGDALDVAKPSGKQERRA